MVIVTATLSFETEADRDRAVELTAPVQKATRDDEPGCLAYCFGADPVEPTHVQVYELWTDPENLAKHFDHPNYAAMVDVLPTVAASRVREPAVGSRRSRAGVRGRAVPVRRGRRRRGADRSAGHGRTRRGRPGGGTSGQARRMSHQRPVPLRCPGIEGPIVVRVDRDREEGRGARLLDSGDARPLRRSALADRSAVDGRRGDRHTSCRVAGLRERLPASGRPGQGDRHARPAERRAARGRRRRRLDDQRLHLDGHHAGPRRCAHRPHDRGDHGAARALG